MGLTQVSKDGVKNDAIDASKLPANSVGASELADNAVDTNAIANNAVTAGKLASGVTDLSNDTSPQLGGQLQSNGQHINLEDNDKLKLGTNGDTELYHNNTDGKIENHTGDLYINNVGANSDDIIISAKDDVSIQIQNGEQAIWAKGDEGVRLYYDNSQKLETQSYGINVQGVNSYNAQIKIHNQPTIGRSYWGWANNQSYTGTLIGRTDNTVASTIFMGVDTTGNGGGSFGGMGSEIVFRRDHIFTTPNAANNNFVTCMRFGRATSTEGAVAFTNGLMFGNDQADANILNDYEEGTWTPDLRVASYLNNANSFTYTSRTGIYTKIGNKVYINAYWQVSNYHTYSGNLYLFGLPYAPAQLASNINPILTIVGDGANLSNNDMMFALVEGGNSRAVLGHQGGSGWSHLVRSEVDIYGMYLSGNYEVN